MERIAICGGRLLTPQGILGSISLLAEDGVITAIIPEITPISGGSPCGCKGTVCIPRLRRYLPARRWRKRLYGPDADTYYTVLSTHLKYGTTSVMPTLMSASAKHTIRAAGQYVRALARSPVPAIYWVRMWGGLHISPESEAGAQESEADQGL